jgi:hypothetical protein
MKLKKFIRTLALSFFLLISNDIRASSETCENLVIQKVVQQQCEFSAHEKIIIIHGEC